MGHQITALIAKPSLLDAFAVKYRLHRPVGLEQGLSALPLLDEHIDLISPDSAEPINGFHCLSEGLMQILALASADGALAYVETEYFGGYGTQGAMLFESGRNVAVVGDIGPINRVLRRMGVKITDGVLDEFEAVGLQRHRHTEDWLDT